MIALIMAGGRGTRLWPRSTERRPKQFAHVLGEGSMIQNTVARLAPMVPAENIFVVTSQDMVHLLRDQLPSIPPENIFSEPIGRNTAPCIALGVTRLSSRFSEDEVMVVLPSDHVIHNVREFQLTIDRSVGIAGSIDSIVTIGIMPTRAETGFGYIQTGDVVDLPVPFRDLVRQVRTFAEKPDAATAQRFIDSGDFLWNAGIFVGRLDVMRRAIDKHLPDHAPLFGQIARDVNTDRYEATLENMYRQMRSISWDVGVMEVADNVVVLDATFGWSDVGTWDEIYRLSMKDGKNNVVEGNVVSLNTTNCLISSESGRMVGVVGLDNIIVVETDSAVMICPRGEAEAVRDLVDLMRRRHITMHL